MLMNGGVVREFGMERGGHDVPMLHEGRLATVFRQDFNVRSGVFNDGATDEYHLERFFLQFRRAADHITGYLAPISIAQHCHIEKF